MAGMKIEASDGCPIHVRELTRVQAGGPAVLLVHALAMDGTMWQRVADAMAVPARVFAIDCRGHGQSGKSAGPYATELFAMDVHDVAEALGLHSFVLGGCSMGGTVAQAFAGLWPDRLEGLLLVDTTAWYGPGAIEAWEARAARALGEGLGAMIDFQRERWFSPAFIERHPEVLQEAIEVFLRNDPRAYAETCRMLGHADERHGLASYAGPARIVVGEHDHATPPAMAADLAARIPGSKVQVIPHARHFTPYEAPRDIAAALDALLTPTTVEEKT